MFWLWAVDAIYGFRDAERGQLLGYIFDIYSHVIFMIMLCIHLFVYEIYYIVIV